MKPHGELVNVRQGQLDQYVCVYVCLRMLSFQRLHIHARMDALTDEWEQHVWVCCVNV